MGLNDDITAHTERLKPHTAQTNFMDPKEESYVNVDLFEKKPVKEKWDFIHGYIGEKKEPKVSFETYLARMSD